MNNLAGQTFGMLTVITRGQHLGVARRAAWLCECICGNTITRETSNLKNSSPFTSCGCVHVGNYSHGQTIGGPTSLYGIWCAMKRRCLNPACEDWIDYGGRGIKVCDRWMTFENFRSDMGKRPEGKSIDRINVNGDYELSNCRWATPEQQSANKR